MALRTKAEIEATLALENWSKYADSDPANEIVYQGNKVADATKDLIQENSDFQSKMEIVDSDLEDLAFRLENKAPMVTKPKIAQVMIEGAAALRALLSKAGPGVSFVLEWDAAPRPPAHMTTMRGRQSFSSFDEAIEFMAKKPEDSVFVSLTRSVTAHSDVTAQAIEALKK